MNPVWVIRMLSVSAGIAGLSMVAVFAWQAAADVDTSPPARTQQVQEETDDPEVQDSEMQDPEVQDPEIQDPDADDPDPDDPDPNDLDPDDPGAGDPDDPDPDDPDPDDPEVQNPEIQEPEVQEPEIDDPDPGGLSCPETFTPQIITFNAPGGQVEMFVCARPAK